MNKLYIKYLFLLPIYVLLQVFVLNEVLFFSYINPFLYIILIISLPLKTPKWFLLIYAFILGCFIDLFSASLGFHSTATVLIAFIKPFISKISIPHNILDENDKISMKKIGGQAFMTFSFLLIIIHNCCLFVLEHLNFSLDILIKIIGSAIVTLIIVLITQLLESRKE